MRTTMEEKKMHIELWKESGLSKSEYAKQIGIDRNQFYSWFRQMHCNDVKANDFVRVSCTTESAEEIQQDGIDTISGGILIELSNGYRIEILPDYHEPTLKKVLSLLESR